MKRGEITLKEAGYLLLGLMVVAAVLVAGSRGCDLVLSNKEKIQAEGTLVQLSNLLSSIKEGEQNNFILYSPQNYYLTSFSKEQSFFLCSTDCLCICEEKTCLEDKSYCQDISKPLNEKILVEIIGVKSLIINNQKESYQFVEAVSDILETESKANPNCSGEIVPFVGNEKIKSSVIPAFELAQKYAAEKGVQLVVTDAYRTLEIQKARYGTYGDLACYPVGSGMNCPHVSGCAVDVCLSRNGVLSDICYRTKYDLSPTLKNSDTLLLKEIMERAGFKGISSEYWHFEYGLDKQPLTLNFDTQSR